MRTKAVVFFLGKIWWPVVGAALAATCECAPPQKKVFGQCKMGLERKLILVLITPWTTWKMIRRLIIKSPVGNFLNNFIDCFNNRLS